MWVYAGIVVGKISYGGIAWLYFTHVKLFTKQFNMHFFANKNP